MSLLYNSRERREYRPLSHEGYWDEQVAQSTTPTCVSTDPAADFRWHGHHCGGPEVASFICELPGNRIGTNVDLLFPRDAEKYSFPLS